MGTIELHSVLKNISKESLTTSELNYIIKYSFTIAKAIIKKSFSSKLYLNGNSDLTIDDIAMDSITQLFIKNSKNELGIKSALDNWNDKIDSTADANFFLHKIVWSRVEQTVTQIYKDRDPIFAKIHKTISVCIKNNNYKKLNHLGTVFIVEKNCKSISGNIIDDAVLDSIPENIFTLKQNKLFEALFNYIVEETEFFPAIPLNNLVKRIKKHHFIEYKKSHPFFTEREDNFYFDEIIESGLRSLSSKIETFYIAKEKLTEEEADMFMASFQDISKDLMSGGINSSLYSYLKYQKKSLTQEEFYSKYHHIMNYLLNDFKNNIAKLI